MEYNPAVKTNSANQFVHQDVPGTFSSIWTQSSFIFSQAKLEKTFQSCPWQPRKLLVTELFFVVGTYWTIWTTHETSRDLTTGRAGLSWESKKNRVAGNISSWQTRGWMHPSASQGFFFLKPQVGFTRMQSRQGKSQCQNADLLLLGKEIVQLIAKKNTLFVRWW